MVLHLAALHKLRSQHLHEVSDGVVESLLLMRVADGRPRLVGGRTPGNVVQLRVAEA
jgi:hypothetical protein